MIFDIVGLLGHLCLSYVYISYLIKNADKETTIVVSSMLMALGYLLLSSEMILDIKDEIDEKEKEKTNKKRLSKQYSYGRIVLALFYILSFTDIINPNRKTTDMLALIGHLVLIKDNGLLGIGSFALILYYMLYIYRNFEKDFPLLNTLQVVGGILLLIHHGNNLRNEYLEYKKEDSNEEFNESCRIKKD